MKSFLLNLLLLILIPFFNCFAQVKVKGYYRSNGTYVQPHFRSSPDNNPYNNYSYPGNYNPYTGKTAKGNEDTYLDNYYNRSSSVKPESTYKSNTNGTRAKPSKIVFDSNGNYGIQYSYEYGATKYYLFSSSHIKYGKVFFFDDGDMCVYDLSNTLIKRISNVSLDSYTSGDYNQNYYTEPLEQPQNSIKQSVPMYPTKVDFGNGSYMVEYERDSNVTKYTVYNSENVKYGKIYVFEDGDMCFYDNSNNLIKRMRYK